MKGPGSLALHLGGLMAKMATLKGFTALGYGLAVNSFCPCVLDFFKSLSMSPN